MAIAIRIHFWLFRPPGQTKNRKSESDVLGPITGSADGVHESLEGGVLMFLNPGLYGNVVIKTDGHREDSYKQETQPKRSGTRNH